MYSSLALGALLATTSIANPAKAELHDPGLAVYDETVNETDAKAVFQVSRVGPLNKQVRFQFETIDVTAKAGIDYTKTIGEGLVRKGAKTTTITVPVINNKTVDGTRTFHVRIFNPSTGTIVDDIGIGTIENDDVAPPTQTCWDGSVILTTATCPSFPTITVANTTSAETTSALNFVVTRGGYLNTTTTLQWTPVAGTATSGSDYVATNGGTLVFNPGETVKSVAIDLINDSLVENNETVVIHLTGSNVVIAGDAVGTITSEDVALPTGPIENKVAAEGDSISVYWGGNHTGIYDATHANVSVCGLAVGGSGITSVISREAGVIECNAEVVTLLIGANGMYSGTPGVTTDDWLAKVWSYTDDLRSKGYKIAVGTILPQYNASNPAWSVEFNRRRNTEANPGIRAAIGTHIDAVIDFAADPVMGPDSAAQNTSLYRDGVHPTDGNSLGTGGQNRLADIYSPVVDKLLAQVGLTKPPVVIPPITGTNGADPIPSNFDLSTVITTANIPVDNGTDPVGAFRFICGAGQLLYDDPVVHPGMPGKSHLHQYYGNTKANANSTFKSLRENGDSTCNNNPTGADNAANRSAYWMPGMLDGKGHVIMPDYVQVYYKQEPNSSDTCTKEVSIGGLPITCVGIPNGIKFIQGFNMATGTDSTSPGWYACRGTGAANVAWKSNAEGLTLANNTTCPTGGQLEMTMTSLRCWNGELDSPDHMSHLVGMIRDRNTGQPHCPDTHRKKIPVFTISAFYTIGAGDDVSLWHLSSDEMYPQYYRGKTLHLDYFEAWDASVKDMWWKDGCIAKHLNCSGGNLGNGKKLIGASQPKYGWRNPNRLVDIPMNPNGTMAH